MSIPIAMPKANEHWPLDRFKPNPKELARHDDPEKIRLLGEDMLAKGQLQAVGATEDGRQIFGHQRLLAARAVGIKTLEVKIFPASLPDTQFKLISASENLHRKELTSYQRWVLCADLMCGNPTWQMKDLAQALHLDPSMVTRLLSPSKCIPAAQEALKADTITLRDCYALSQIPAEDQQGLLNLRLAPGGKLSDVEQAGRKRRNGSNGDAVKMPKVPIAMPGGKKVVLTGNDLGMVDVVELLAEALKEAKKAAETFDVKTFVSMMKDKSKG